jgi:very-short-patch-repair endonuclease
LLHRGARAKHQARPSSSVLRTGVALSTEHPAASTGTERPLAAIDHWKRKLLDLSRRNRLLNFRLTRVSTVAVTGEQPAEVFRRLYLQEKPMKFSAATAPEDSAGGPAPEPMLDTVIEPFDEAEVQAPSSAPYDSAVPGDRHRDDVLQTSSEPEQLDRSLRRIDEQSRETQEEQGVNALFLAVGMLHYWESADSEQVFRAPLVLLPVALERKSAGAGYTLRASEDDPVLNPALGEYLRRSFGIALPELPDWASIPDDYDLEHFLTAAKEAVAAQARWEVTPDIYLGLFAFQKFVMYKDLEASGEAFAQHHLIQQLINRQGGSLAQLPDEIREMTLDDDFPPERTAQVVDADGSQLRAIAAVSRGYDLVLEGPPGTGKSQTITNLIAQALSDGRSVLFVAEKMAALSVVHDRLVKAGLGDFCLELHSAKANKRAVVKEIARSLDASLARPKPLEPGSAARLESVRTTLTQYVEALHTPWGAPGFSPFQGFGELASLKDADRVTLEAALETLPRDAFESTVRDLEDLARAAAELGDPSSHPWRDSARTLWSEDDRERARTLIRSFREQLAETRRLAAEAEPAFGLPTLRTMADVDTAVRVAEVLGRSPGAPLTVLRSDAWNAPPRDALELVARGRRVRELRDHVSHRLSRDALAAEHSADAGFIEEKETGFLRFLNFLSGRFRAVRHRWVGYRLAGYAPSLLEQAGDMRKADELRRERSALAAADASGAALFGALWQGEHSDWEALDGYVRWVVEFRGACVSHGLAERASEMAAAGHPDVSLAERLRAASEAARQGLAQLRVLAEWPNDYLALMPLEALESRAAALESAVEQAPRWAAWEMVRRRVAAGPGAGLLEAALAGQVGWARVPAAFRRAFHQRWVDAAVRERSALRDFATLTHEARAEEFRRLDEQVLRENRDRLVAELRDRVQLKLRDPVVQEVMPYLQREMAKERRHAPLRRTLRQAGPAIRAIKPCFMMSPLTVAQLMEGGSVAFDLVIFDEASQLPSEDAVGAIARGGRLVVVGDPKQLPPTNFFSVMGGQVDAPLGEDGIPIVEDTESVLEEFLGAGVPKTRLRWHYRSAHESLITFSNVQFYDADLHTFPSASGDAEGLQFRFVRDGVYEGKGLNLVEARAVVDEVVRHAREQPSLSLGVGTFNLRQQLAIQDELELRRREDPTLEPFFARDRPEPFFVKNLENIQGDERDVILLSVTYGKGREGRLRHNFGPINGENGWRRLNVLTTRARQRMVVFSSMRGDDIDPSATTSRGAALLREFLLYAERGQLHSAVASAAAEVESGFEREVFAELTARGLQLRPQVGVAGYRVDFGVVDPAAPGRFVCGIECDGAAYHNSETARDRDRLRQQVLERRGWVIHRLWSTDWFKDRAGQIERMLRLVEESRAGRHDASPAAVEPAAPTPAPPEQQPDEALEDSAELPVAAPYRMADASARRAGSDFMTAPARQLEREIAALLEVEAPLHLEDLVDRIVDIWELPRAGARVEARVLEALAALEREGEARRRGEFVWGAGEEIEVRSRAGTGIPAERIPPEEVRAAVLRALSGGEGLPRRDLTAAVRSLFGYARTGPRLEEAVTAVVDALLAEGAAGEASSGIKLRR